MPRVLGERRRTRRANPTPRPRRARAGAGGGGARRPRAGAELGIECWRAAPHAPAPQTRGGSSRRCPCTAGQPRSACSRPAHDVGGPRLLEVASRSRAKWIFSPFPPRPSSTVPLRRMLGTVRGGGGGRGGRQRAPRPPTWPAPPPFGSARPPRAAWPSQRPPRASLTPKHTHLHLEEQLHALDRRHERLRDAARQTARQQVLEERDGVRLCLLLLRRHSAACTVCGDLVPRARLSAAACAVCQGEGSGVRGAGGGDGRGAERLPPSRRLRSRAPAAVARLRSRAPAAAAQAACAFGVAGGSRPRDSSYRPRQRLSKTGGL